jgi:hypothetical protein
MVEIFFWVSLKSNGRFLAGRLIEDIDKFKAEEIIR